MKAIRCSVLAGLALAQGVALASSLQQAANDACQCAQEPYAKMEQLKGVLHQAMTSGDYSEMIKLEGDFAGLQDRAMSCYNELKVKYPRIHGSPELQEQVVVIMKQQCPPPLLSFGAEPADP